MTRYPDLSSVRNIGVVAHVDAGKTTLTERILFYTGASHKIGEVHDGAAHMDYLAEEQAHGITITAAVTKADWQGHLLQLVDTPGHVDFTIEVERAMRVLDGCVIVLDGVRGVEPQTETVWRQRARFGLPALFFVNKMDRPGADFDRALATMRKRLGAEPVAVTVPVGETGAVVHLVEGTLVHFGGEQGEVVRVEPCPADLWASLSGHRETLLLAVAEGDDALAEQVLGGGEPAPAAVWAALRRATLEARVFPCCAGSALRNQGVQPLLDAVVRLLPGPLDRPPAAARTPDGDTETVAMDPGGPLVALAFKVQLWDGRRHVFARIYRGVLEVGDKVAIPQADGSTLEEHAARIFDVDAHRKTRMDRATAGQIVLLAGLRRATTGDTLCAPGHPLLLERIEAREPVIGLAIEPASREEEEKLLEVLGKVVQEDPTLRLEEDPETGQRLLRGMGELHLHLLFERLEREFGVRVRTGRPDVALRETVTGEGTGEVHFNRVLEMERKPLALEARVATRARPRPRQAGNRIQGFPTVLPAGTELNPVQREAVVQGTTDVLGGGPLEGAPVEDVELVVEEVELFGAASSPEALRAAASKAAVKALTAAGGVLLRPIMATEVVVPGDNLGTVLGDLQARQAVILGTESLGDTAVVQCEVGLDRLLGYATELRSLTQGRGQFSMVFRRFDTG